MNRRFYRLYRKWWWVAVAVIAVIIIAILVLRPALRQVLNSNVGVVSTILSALLVILYFGQHRLLRRQLELEHKPHVEIQRYETDGRKLVVWLSNLGNGVATNIEIEACIDFHETDNFSPGCASDRFRRVGEEGDYKKRVGNSLRAGEHDIRFVAEPAVDITPDEPNHGWGLRAATERLVPDGVEEVTLEFWVTSEDLLGRKDRETVFGRPSRVEIDGRGIDMDGFMENRKIEWEDW